MYAPTLRPVDIPSGSTPGAVYHVTDSCQCKAFQFRGTCRHLAEAAAQRAIVRCYYCGTNPSPDGIAACSYCVSLLADMVEQSRDETDAFLARIFPAPMAVEPASCEWPSFVHCVATNCGRVYPFSDEHPLLCPACELAASVAA